MSPEILTRDVVDKWLSQSRSEFSERDIRDDLSIVTPEGKEALRNILNQLLDEGKICNDGNNHKFFKMDFALFPTVINLKGIKAEGIKWLWHPYIPYGKLTLLEGDPGIGKSWLTLAIITAITLGQGIPGQSEIAEGPCMIASAEDGIADTIVPRLVSMGANMELVNAVNGIFTLDELGFQWLENNIIENIPVFLVIDPLVAFISGNVDIHKANQVRYATARIAKLSEKYGIATLAIRHLTKETGKKAIYRGLGSIDFTAAARSVLLAGEDGDTGQRGFVHIKSNLAKLGDPVGYELKDNGFYWLEHCELTSEKILQGITTKNSPELDKAISFLTDMLKDGPLPANEIYEEAANKNISQRTLKRAKEELDIPSEKVGQSGKKGGGTWYWKLPGNMD